MSTELPSACSIPCVQYGPIASYLGVVKSVPFAARYEEVHVRRDSRGVSSEERVIGTIYRDGAGRVRREYQMRGSNGEALGLVVISDLAARTVVALDLAGRQATRFTNMGAPPDEMPQGGWAFSGLWSLEGGANEKMIEGVACKKAHRVVLTKGSVVKSTEVGEIWVSAGLKFAVYEHESDPHREYTWRLFDIQRAEPPSSLFAIPAGFTELVPSKYEAAPPER